MSNEFCPKGLYYNYRSTDYKHKLFQEIDSVGGWPISYKFVGFAHSDKREVIFSNTSNNTDNWTYLYCADDYYMWKLSVHAWQRIIDGINESITTTMRNYRMPATALNIVDSRGYKATLTPDIDDLIQKAAAARKPPER